MSTAELNRKYFDAVSDSYDSKPWWTTVNNQISDALRSDLPWLGIPFANIDHAGVQHVRLLDYACGTGLMSRVFEPFVTQTRGIDISPNMVNSFNSRSASANLSPEIIHAVVGDLFSKTDPSPAPFSAPEWHEFDIATVGFAFHHFEDVVFAASQLKNRLRPGGVLVLTDFMEGGDWLADEEGELIEGSKGNHAVHKHNHGDNHGHGRDDGQQQHHHHHHHTHTHTDATKHDIGETNQEFLKKMNDSIVVPHFSLDGMKNFLTEAGLVEVDVKVMGRVYIELGGKKLWRTVLFGKGRRSIKDDGKSEL